MTDYSVFVLLILMLPVTLQIILPLVILAVFSLLYFLKTVFRRRDVHYNVNELADISESLQAEKS